jgi:cell division septal protein FtsQ
MSPTMTRSRPAGGTGGVKRSGIDPRISARRDQVTRERGRRRLQVLSILGGLGVLVVGGWFLLHTPWFSARVVTVTGATHETPAQVIAASGLGSHPALLNVNASAVAAAVERMPWVRTATVKVSWPDAVRIAVTEQVAQVDMKTAAGTWAAVTADGRVLADQPAQTPGVVTMTGPAMPGAPGSTLGAADRIGLEVALTLPASFKAQVTGVVVEPGAWVQLTMTTPIAVDIGTASQLTQKYEDVSSILAGASLHPGDVIDVSVPDAPTVTEE